MSGKVPPDYPFFLRLSIRFYKCVFNMSVMYTEPLVEIVDKVFKREYRNHPKQMKHEQDITNLREIIPIEDINRELELKLNSGK